MNDKYLREQLRKTDQLLAFDSSIITLRRKLPVQRSAAGGVVRGEWSARPPQTLFFAAKSLSPIKGATEVIQTVQGARVTTEYVLVGLPDADIKEGDEFTVRGQDYYVTYVHTNLPYETRADVKAVSGGH